MEKKIEVEELIFLDSYEKQLEHLELLKHCWEEVIKSLATLA